MEQQQQPAPPGEEGLPPALPHHWLLPPQYAQPNQFQLPPGFPWWIPPQHHQQPPKITLTPFWHADLAAWIRLAEATFNSHNVHDVHLRFDVLLPALPENALTQLRDILRAADALADSYETLKAELILQFSPNIHEQLNKLVYTPELGRQAPTQLMRWLLVCLPAGEPAGLLFQHLFLLKLPGDLNDQVAKKMERLDARELAEYTDTGWHVHNSKRAPSKLVAAVEPADSPNSDNGGGGELLRDTGREAGGSSCPAATGG